MRKLTNYDNVKYTIECLAEDIPIKGNAMASGDHKVDKACEDRILRELEDNEWAWCQIKVTAEWNGYKGIDCLGCCSYDSLFDFMKCDYYNEMKSNALEDLNAVIGNKFNEHMDLIEKLGG